MKDDKLYLFHISECIARIESYIGGGREEFMASTIIQDAVVRNLQVLSESTQRLSDNLKSKYPKVDWRGVSGFRNVLVHDYIEVDVDVVWEVVERDLPNLKSTVVEALRLFEWELRH